MKLIFLIDNEKTIGGGDYAQFKFAEYLAKRGHDVTVFAVNKYSFIHSLKIKNLDMKFRRNFPRIIKGTGLLNKLWGIIYSFFVVEPFISRNSKNIDYIIGYLRESAIKAVKLGKKYQIKTANFIFENPVWMKKQLGDRFLREYTGKFRESWNKTGEAYKETDILIPNSNLTRKECSSWLDRKISEPVYPGVGSINLQQKIIEQDQIIYLGRLNEYKNINEIIEVLHLIENPPKLVIIGKGEEKNRIMQLAEELGVECEFRGELNDEDKWLEIRKSKFMVFPSSFEGFGMPPAESLMCGKPCICSDIPIFREVYKDKVEYFKEHNLNELAQKMEFLLDNPQYRKKRGEVGRKYILSMYSWEKSASKIEKILKNGK